MIRPTHSLQLSSRRFLHSLPDYILQFIVFYPGNSTINGGPVVVGQFPEVRERCFFIRNLAFAVKAHTAEPELDTSYLMRSYFVQYLFIQKLQVLKPGGRIYSDYEFACL